MSEERGYVKLSFRVDRPAGAEAVQPLVTAEDGWYNAYYRYEMRGGDWWAVLDRIEEIMPPRTPQMGSLTNPDGRLHMMSNGSLNFELEAQQRRHEWREVNEALRA